MSAWEEHAAQQRTRLRRAEEAVALSRNTRNVSVIRRAYWTRTHGGAA